MPGVDYSLSRSETSVLATRAKRPWLNVVTHLEPRYGGLSTAIPAISSATAVAGKRPIRISAFCLPGEEFTPVSAPGVTVHHFRAPRVQWLSDTRMRCNFSELVSSSAGVHIHGLWELATTVAARQARARRKPYIVSAHGMLDPWALSQKGWKKRIYAALFESRNLQSCACLHALTKAEAEDYRSFGLRNPIAIIPNGVSTPAEAHPALFLSRFPELRGKRLILFLGRLHPKKGVDVLCRAWARVAHRFDDAQLVLAGPDFAHTQSKLVAIVRNLGVERQTTFTGMLQGSLKWSAIAAAFTFVLPSYSEGFSMAVLEALTLAKPVIVSKQCNIPEIAQYRCGWIAKPEEGNLAETLTAALQMSKSGYQQMAANGVRLIAARYRWDVVGEKMNSIYRWLEEGSAPDGVEIWEGL